MKKPKIYKILNKKLKTKSKMIRHFKFKNLFKNLKNYDKIYNILFIFY